MNTLYIHLFKFLLWRVKVDPPPGVYKLYRILTPRALSFDPVPEVKRTYTSLRLLLHYAHVNMLCHCFF